MCETSCQAETILSRIASTDCSERCASITASTTFIGGAAPSTPWIARDSPVLSVSTAEPMAWPSACSKLTPSAGAGLGAALTLELGPSMPRADRPSIIISSSLSGASRVLHQCDGLAEHVGRLFGDLEIGFVAAVRLPHVGEFDQHIDIGHFDHAVGVRRRIADVALEPEGRLIHADRPHLDQIGAGCAIDLALERNGLAGIGVCARGGASGLGVRDILGDDPEPCGLSLEARGGDAERGLQRIQHCLTSTTTE